MFKTSRLIKLSLLTFALSACNSDNSSTEIPVVVPAIPVNQAPSLPELEAIIIDENTSKSFFLNATDSDGEITSIQWLQTSGPQITIENDQSGSIVLTAPEVGRQGAFAEFNITVTDNDAATTSVVAIVDIRNVNLLPTAKAGDDQSVRAGNGAVLSGSNSFDPDGTSLTYSWVLSTPMGSKTVLLVNNNVIVNFVPDIAGLYVADLTVTDEDSATNVDQVQIMVEAVNMAPVAIAGLNSDVATGTNVLLSAQESYDPEGAPIAYLWRLETPETSTTLLNASDSITPSFFADIDGEYKLYLTVNDGQIDSAEDMISVTASTKNAPPVSDAGPNQSGSRAIELILDGSGSFDPNDDLLTYSWKIISQPSNSDISILSSNDSMASFIPFAFGDYVLSLTVSDSEYVDTNTTLVSVVEGDIYVDDLQSENLRYAWPFTGFIDLGNSKQHDGDTYELNPSALIATGADFKIKFSAMDKNGVTTPFCGKLFDGQIIKAGEPVYFSCGVNVVKGKAFEVEFRIEIEGYRDRVWLFTLKGTFI